MTKGARHLNQVLKDIYDTAQKFLRDFSFLIICMKKRGCSVQIYMANKITQEAEYNMFTFLAFEKT